MKQFNYKEIEKITTTPITRDLFDIEEYDNVPLVTNGYGVSLLDTNSFWDKIIDYCELLRKQYLETKERKYFDNLVLLLPNSYNLVNLRPSPSYVKKAVKKWSDKTHYYNTYNKEHYEKYKPRIKEYLKRSDVKEKRNKQRKEKYYKDVEKNRKYYREKYHEYMTNEDFRKRMKEYQRQYYQEHREEILKRAREKREAEK